MQQSVLISPHKGIDIISPYKAGEAAPGDGFKLSSNENPLGPSPKAIAAFTKAATGLMEYPDPNHKELRQSIAARYQLNPDNIVCGHGSDELLHLLAQTYLSQGDEAIFTTHGFMMYRIVTLAAGGTPVVANERADLKTDINAITAVVSDRTRIVFIANPHNPAGSYLNKSELRQLRQNLPDHVLLIIDSAYAEYVGMSDYEAGVELVNSHNNVVMTRTFSKIHGLAALRLGWAYCPRDVVGNLNKVRSPFNVAAPSMAAGIAAIADYDYERKCHEYNARFIAWVSDQLKDMGFKIFPSVANFILIDFESDQRAADANQWLAQNRIIVRPMTGYGFASCLRVSIGSERACEAFVDCLRRF